MKIFNKILAVLMGIVVVYLSIKDSNYSYLLFMIALVLPFIVKLPNIVTTVYLVYTFIAIFLGGQYHLYRKTDWFDDFAHFGWGLVSGIVGLYLIHYFKVDKNVFFNVFFIIMVSLAFSTVWELFEYASDTLINTNMQRLETGVTDTMTDIVNALLGNILFVIFYIYEKKHKPLLITKLINEIN